MLIEKNIMYHYTAAVEHLKKLGAKPSAAKLDKIFFALMTQYAPCDLFIEAGAFDATTSKKICSELPNCRTYAFEANYDNYEHFAPSAAAINYLYTAITNYTGSIVFKQQSHTTSGAVFDKIKGNNSTKIRVLDKNTVYTNINVPCDSLDNFFVGKFSSTDSIGLWLDLEGTAYEALTAATEVLRNTSFIKIEVEDQQYWENQKLSADIVTLLDKHEHVPLIRDFEGTSVQQYNILFGHKTLITAQLDSFIEELLDAE